MVVELVGEVQWCILESVCLLACKRYNKMCHAMQRISAIQKNAEDNRIL